MRLANCRPLRIGLTWASSLLLLLLLTACGGGGGPIGDDDSQQSKYYEITDTGAIKHLKDAGPYPSSTYTFLKLLSPHTRSVIKVATGQYHQICCPTRVDLLDGAELAREELLGLEWTGPLATIFEDPAVPRYGYDVIVIDDVDKMLFLGVDITTREPWENVLRDQGYERSEIKDVVLWVGPAPWKAFAFMAHDVIVANTQSNMMELLERRHTGSASLYDIAGDLWESLPYGIVQSLEQKPDGIIEGVSVGPGSGPRGTVEVIRWVDYREEEQGQLDSQEWMMEWRSAFDGICSEPVTSREGLRHKFEALCPGDKVHNELAGP